MNFDNTIYQLINDNDCVIIPNFGVFISRDCPATVNFVKQEFAPPKREVIFNSEINHNDTLLANYLATKHNLSFTQASTLIDRYVAEIKNILQSGNSFSLNKIGTFSLQNNELSFVANPNEKFNNDSYVLGNFIYPYLQKTTPVGKINTQLTRKTNKRNRLWWITAPVAAASLVGAIFLFRNFIPIDNSGLNNHASIFPTEMVKTPEKQIVNTDKETVKEEIIDTAVNPVSENIVAEEPVLEENNTEATIQIKQSTTNLAYTIAGAFKVYQNAVNFQNELIQKGYKSEIISEEGKLYRVSIKSYSSEEEAQNDLLNLSQSTNYPGLWVLFNE